MVDLHLCTVGLSHTVYVNNTQRARVNMLTIITKREWISAYFFRVPYGPRCARLIEWTYLWSRRRGKYDEVKRAHRWPNHEKNIRRYSQARGLYCIYCSSFPLLWSFTDLVWRQTSACLFLPTSPDPIPQSMQALAETREAWLAAAFQYACCLWTSDVDIHKASGWWLVIVLVRFFLLVRFESGVAKWQKGLVLLSGQQRFDMLLKGALINPFACVNGKVDRIRSMGFEAP